MMSCAAPSELLRLFDREKEYNGWYTAKECITRIARQIDKAYGKRSARLSARQFDPTDPRFSTLLAVFEEALDQRVMNSKSRLGHQTDDLSSIRSALEQLAIVKTSEDVGFALHTKLVALIEEEDEEEDEPGEFGHDFQGGAVGF